ncbi:MAG: hypothetical protein ACI3VM_00970 [Oscillospiraceae bacterium]
MKRTLLMILSILLAASSVFGIVTAGNGSDELSDILRFKRGQRSDITELIDDFDARLAKFRKTEENRTDDEKDYTESVVTDQKGSEQLSAGQQQYNAGAAKIAKGQAEYDAAEAQYNAKLAEYQAAEKRLNAAEAQLNDAKAQRDAAQAQLDAATPAYQKAKPIYDLIQSLGGWGDLVSQTLAKYGYTSIEDLKAEMKAYEDGQAALAQANSQIAAAEQEINNGKTQLAAAKTQLDQGKEQLAAAKVQLDNGKAELAAAKNQLDAGQQQLNENADRVDEVRETLKQIDNDEEAVKFGVEELMKYDGIADLVTDTSDYESVSQAARDFIDSDTDKLNAELDLRQNLYNILRIISIIGVIAGVIGVLAARKPNRTRLLAASGATGITAVAALALNIYGLSNGYRSFVYALEDGSGSGKTQLIAMLVLLGVSVAAAIVAMLCSRTFSDVLKGKEKPQYTRPEAPVEAAVGGTPDAEDDDSDEDYKPRRRKDNTSKKKKAARAKAAAEYKPAPAPSDIDELTEQTRRLNEEAERLEAEARQNDYEKARREYEEARRRFEAARRGVSDDK